MQLELNNPISTGSGVLFYIMGSDIRVTPTDMGEPEVVTFLTHLSVNRKVAPGTQGQALNALVFLYRKVLHQPLGELQGIVRAKKKERIPVVLTQSEVADVLSRLEHTHWLVACILYGSDLRLMECIRLRVKDLDLDRLSITVRSGKGDKDRRAPTGRPCSRGAR